MKVYSFIRQGLQLKPIEVEVSLTPGLPMIQFMGLPDTAIKESIARIRSALYHQGFSLPASRQVLVNLRPNYLKKTSRGLDLAVAAAILWETQQLPPPEEKTPYLYGELDLKGDVLAPDDLQDLSYSELELLHTGLAKSLNIATAQLKNLQSLLNPDITLPEKSISDLKRPTHKSFLFSEEQAQVLQLIAYGEHPTLLAGPAGLGKTTMAQSLPSLLKAPDAPLFHSIRRMHPHHHWRPFENPHHSITPRAMTGGGAPPLPGVVTRAHGGILLLDELLEFSPAVFEALREPIEAGQITISRGTSQETFPADFLLLATTNLCPCGQFLPEKQNCRCRAVRLRSYLERLRGPTLDRFAVTYFLQPQKDAKISLEKIYQKVEKTRQLKRPAPQKQGYEFFEKNENSFLLRQLIPKDLGSHRRKLSLLRVARSLADLDQEKQIQPDHLQRAMELTIIPFQQLNQGLL